MNISPKILYIKNMKFVSTYIVHILLQRIYIKNEHNNLTRQFSNTVVVCLFLPYTIHSRGVNSKPRTREKNNYFTLSILSRHDEKFKRNKE